MSIQTRVSIAVIMLMGATVLMAVTMYWAILGLKSELGQIRASDRMLASLEGVPRPVVSTLRQELLVVEQRSQRVLALISLVTVLVPLTTMTVAVILLGSTFRRIGLQLTAIHRWIRDPRTVKGDTLPDLGSDELGTLAAAFNATMRGLSRVTVAKGELQDALAKLEDARSRLVAAQKLEEVGTLAGGVAHDFSNLLTVIRSRASSAVSAIDDNEPARQEIERILSAVGRADNLIRQLFFYTTSHSGQGREINLNERVQSLRGLLTEVVGPDIKIVIRLAPDLWGSWIDPTQVDQILINLVKNAGDAMQAGGTVTIATSNVTAEEPASLAPNLRPCDGVLLTVTDTGSGIPDDVRSRMFEPFFTTKEPSKGTGLGLSICQRIVRKAGGDIFVESSVTAGTCFEIFLPRGHQAAASAPGSIRVGDVPGGSETVLLIEGEPALRRQSVRVLRDRGYGVLEAENGAVALGLLERGCEHLDLIITEVRTRELDGLELVRRARAAHPKIRVLFTTTLVTDPGTFKEQAMSVLVKPFLPWQLARQVRDVLDEKRGTEIVKLQSRANS